MEPKADMVLVCPVCDHSEKENGIQYSEMYFSYWWAIKSLFKAKAVSLFSDTACFPNPECFFQYMFVLSKYLPLIV